MDRNGPSAHKKAYLDLGKIIKSTQKGDQLPSEPKLAEILGVSRTIVREILPLYENQGVLVRRHGIGTFVANTTPIIDSGLEVLTPVEALADQSGLEMRCAVLKILPRLATENEISILGLERGDSIIQITRVMEVDNNPIAFMLDILPEGLLTAQELSTGFDGSVLNLFLAKGENSISNSYTEIKPILADKELSTSLKIKRGEMVLSFVSTSYNLSGDVLYYSIDSFLPQYFNFHIIRRASQYPDIDT